MQQHVVDAGISRHCVELNRCNQRGGRMLSLLDLLDAGSLDLELAAFLMSRVSRGVSFMVGARPGGAGKTTVMCALLNLCPRGVALVAATGESVRTAGREGMAGRRCYVCHEIGAGPYFSYLWGEDLRTYCALTRRGHLLATNLHADDLEDTRLDVCEKNGVPARDFHAFGLLVYLRVDGGWRARRHWIEKVYASDGVAGHVQVFDRSAGLDARKIPGGVDLSWLAQCRAFLAALQDSGVRTIEEVRERVVALYDYNDYPRQVD